MLAAARHLRSLQEISYLYICHDLLLCRLYVKKPQHFSRGFWELRIEKGKSSVHCQTALVTNLIFINFLVSSENLNPTNSEMAGKDG